MTKLTELLRYETASESQKKKILDSYSFNSCLDKGDKELLLSSDFDSGELLREEVYNAINTGAQRRQVMRKILPTIQVNSYQVKPITGTKPSGNLAQEISEGNSFPIKTNTYASGAVNTKQYGLRSQITQELIEDKQFGIIEAELNKLGEAIENKLNEVVIQKLIDDHNGTTPSDVDATSAPLKYEHIGDAYEELGTLGWKPTDIIFRPRAVGQLITNTPKNINYDGGKLFGLNSYVLDTPSDDWVDNDASGKYFGILLDSQNYGFIAIRKDITLDVYEEPVNDLTNFIVSMRFGVGVSNDDAAVRILTV